MRDETYDKNRGLDDTARELSGLYGTGFERESVMGFVLPFAIVFIVGGLGGLLIWKWL
jgi:hypothetical protein